MRLLVLTEPGVLELNYTWLPVWIGINTSLKNDLEKDLQEKFIGREVGEGALDEMNEAVIDWLVKRFPQVEGLRDYLDGLKFVRIK